jgi:hypothetical protein
MQESNEQATVENHIVPMKNKPQQTAALYEPSEA